MTPDERAEAAVIEIMKASVKRLYSGGFDERGRMQREVNTAIIASALRSAENEAIDRCCREMMAAALTSGGGTPQPIAVLTVAAGLIRALKHKEL